MMNKKNKWFLPVLAALAGFVAAMALPSSAAVVRVHQDGSGNFTTIQAAVNAMAAGDTCLVGPGMYNERVHFSSAKSGHAGALTLIQAETPLTATNWGFDTSGCNYLQIQGFTVVYSSTQTGTQNGIGIYVNGNNNEIIGNYIVGTHYPGIQGGNANFAHIAGNHMYLCGMGFVIGGAGWLVESNNVERLQYFSELGDADFSRFFGSNHVIRANWFHGTVSGEIGPAHVDGFQTYDDNGAFAEHIRIDGNRIEGFFNEGVMAEAIYHNTGFDITICNNLFNGTGAGWAVILSTNLHDVNIYNNDITGVDCGIYVVDRAAADIRNNIFYNVTCFLLQGTVTGGSNLLYRPGGSVSPLFTGDTVNQDPRFVNLAGGDFHLLSNSPAINRGATLAIVTNDFDGLARPQGTAYDIGALEYALGTVSSPLLKVSKQGTNVAITLTGQTGHNYDVNATTNFQNWTPITNVTLTNTNFQFTQPATGPRRYYRGSVVQ